MYFAIHQISPHLLFFCPRKRIVQRNHRRTIIWVKKYFYLIKTKACVSRDCEYTCPFKPESNPKPLSCDLI
ncbi:hypothetical protein Hanom_Chr12g01158971 [Helianthus anomalus]